jgi:sugar-specific transcriptional regulator TrmB
MEKNRGAVMHEDLVNKMTSFGFTVNQAKVYLSIVQSGKIQVGKISKQTQLHRQDIYKLLPKLEKMGLITKTIEQPFVIEAVPIDKALDTLISKEKEKANNRISDLENNLKDMMNSIQKQPESKDDARFRLLTTDEAIRNRRSLTFKKLKREFLVVTSFDHIQFPSIHFKDFLRKISSSQAKTRLIVVSKESDETVKQAIEKIAQPKGQFATRTIGKNTCKNYQIIDGKEIWIATQQKTESGYPCMFWTNDQNIIEVYKENFKKAWNRAKTTAIMGVTVSSVACMLVSFVEMFA